MARLEAQSKILYYPTPENIVSLVASWFLIEGSARLVDPCCGKGEALRQLADLLGQSSTVDNPSIETWGIEISYSRAEAAAEVLDVVLPVSFYDVRTPAKWSNASVSMAFNNPPYDWSHFTELRRGKQARLRHEVLFIEWTTPRIVPGGHQVIIVPQGILGDAQLLGEDNQERLARHLAGWYEDISIYRFPGDQFEQFRQVVVFACRKRERYQPPGKERIEHVVQASSGDLPELEAGQNEYIVPNTPCGAFRFTYTPVQADDLARLARKCSPIGSPEYQRATYVRPLGAPFTPATPISLGHITMLINGQETGVLELSEGGDTILVKGMTRKTVQTSAADFTNEKGEYTHTQVVEKEQHTSTLAVVHFDGALKLLQRPDEVGDFMVQNAEPLAEAILNRNQPLYGWDPTRYEWEVVGKSALGLPPLPGRKEKGLFNVQKHFAIAASRVMKEHRHCIFNAEMGYGKTSTSIAALELMDEWPIMIMCPGHMVWKWKRDLERASDPCNPIAARVVTRPVLSEPPGWLRLRSELEAAGAKILDVDRFQVVPESPNDPGGRRGVVLTGGNSAIHQLLMAQSFRDKDTKKVIQTLLKRSGDLIVATCPDRDEYTLMDFVTDYRSGRLGRKAAAIIGFEPAKYDAGADREPAVRYYHRRVYNEAKYRDEIQRVPTCPQCGVTLAQSPPRTCPACGSPLFNFNRWRRVGLARLVQKKFRHFFRVYLADEVHKCQNGRSDIGTADQRLLSSIRYSLALTGTLFGGSASSLFFLLYRRLPVLRRLYGFDEMTRWVDHYGLWERTWDQKEPLAGEYGAATGIQRWNYRQRELPGVGPGVIRYLLPITLFGNITDLGYELPPLYEDVDTLEMTSQQASQYEQVERELLQKALECMRSGDSGALSVWFNTVRFRPASSFRDEVVAFTGRKGTKIHMELPSVLTPDRGWLPKEVRLAEIVRENMHRGRKTLVFVEQTGSRDIRERLMQAILALAPGGNMTLVQVDTLSAGDMSPSKREAWIRLNAPSMDALLVNPRLVETGLDLVMFSDLVFYETTVSLYVLWQSMRRVWRLGQDRDVRVTFLAYANTIEEEILQRMGRKMKFAQLLYGKDASGVLVETDGDDIQREIINAALSGKAYRNPGEAVEKLSVFHTETERVIQVSRSPMGSSLAASPVVVQAVELPGGEVYQLTLIPGFEPVPVRQRKTNKRR